MHLDSRVLEATSVNGSAVRRRRTASSHASDVSVPSCPTSLMTIAIRDGDGERETLLSKAAGCCATEVRE